MGVFALASYNVCVLSHSVSDSLHDQLGLAEKDEDVYAQIELIRRILEKDPDDSELLEQLVELWLSVEDYDMAETQCASGRMLQKIRASVLAAVLFARDQKRTEAVAMLESYLAGQPENLEITRQLAEYLHAMDEQRGYSTFSTSRQLFRAMRSAVVLGLSPRQVAGFWGSPRRSRGGGGIGSGR